MKPGWNGVMAYRSTPADSDPLRDLDLGWVGPAEEDDPEDGMEAAPRMKFHGSQAGSCWEVHESCLPDPEEVWSRDLESHRKAG